MDPSAEDHEQVADHLSEATLEIERVDLNVLLEDEVLAVLLAQKILRSVCINHRRRQRDRGRGDDEDQDQDETD